VKAICVTTVSRSWPTLVAAGPKNHRRSRMMPAAQRSFVHAVDVVDVIGLAGEVGLRLPVVIAEGCRGTGPVNSLPPDLVIVETTPPVNRPYLGRDRAAAEGPWSPGTASSMKRLCGWPRRFSFTTTPFDEEAGCRTTARRK
jgi:hypothetical protein